MKGSFLYAEMHGLETGFLNRFNRIQRLFDDFIKAPPHFPPHFSCRQWTFVYLSLIPLVTQSLSPDRSLGLGLWLSHQMLIAYCGWVWEPENELLTDNSQLCTLHEKKEIEGKREAKWETGRIMRSLFNSHIYTKNIVAPLRKSLFGAVDDWHDIKLLFFFLGPV